MKRCIKKVLEIISENDRLWQALDKSVLPVARYLDESRRKCRPYRDRLENLPPQARAIVATRTVLHGPFSGMRYPTSVASGSSLFPKLLGSYERELHPVIEKLPNKGYSEIIDIGCAEGYYAVGLGLLFPAARIHAFDIDSGALSLCREMAALNAIGDRLTCGPSCDAKTLIGIPIRKKALIFVDCEGYETQLLTQEVADTLHHCDFLVETHDFLDPAISITIRTRFEQTHCISALESIDDIKKAQSYSYRELDQFDVAVRRTLFAERRPSIMEWLFMESESIGLDLHSAGEARGQSDRFD